MLKKQFIPPRLTVFEWVLLASSLITTTVLNFIFPAESPLSFVAALLGFVALIFTAKGAVIGQMLIVVFATLYGIISCSVGYYGEMLTYVCMSAPVAICAIISWLRHPYRGSAEVAVRHLSCRDFSLLLLVTLLVTTAFYFLLAAFGTANLLVSTISVATSFFAASLTFLRSPYYALGYVANDVVLIVLWSMMLKSDRAALSMIVCFSFFLFHDLYGFYSWRRMEKRQQANA